MTRTRLACYVLVAACLSLPALAGLGDDAATVSSDLAHMKGQLRVENAPAYTVHVISAAHDTVMREYVSGTGKVFAISWRSASPPDLQRLLSRYYPQYVKSPAVGPADRHHASVAQPGLVVQSTAHARTYFTRAWAPDLLPPNFSVNDIN